MSAYTTPNAYVYQALGDREIRLLELFADEFDSPLQCRIFTANLDETPAYEALSYVWGPQTPPCSLYCTGYPQDEGTGLSIGPNLSDALRYIRYKPTADNPSSIILWTDRVCINQKDDQERSSQVRLMGEIYECSGQTIVWLGIEDEYTHLAFESTEFVYRKRLEKGENPILYAAAYAGERFTPSHFDISLDASKAIYSILNREWFERGWMLQEAVLPQRVLIRCGSLTMPIEWCQSTWMPYSLIKMPERPRIINPLAQLRARFHESSNHRFDGLELCRLLRERRNFKLSIPHDIIYSVLGLFKPSATEAIAPDYSSPFADALTRTATFSIRENKALYILSEVENPKYQADSNCPTWVPDWRASDATVGVGFSNHLPPISDYDATRNIPHYCKPLLGARELEVSAIFLGTVKQHGDYHDLHTIGEFGLPNIYKHTSQPIVSALRQTLILDKAHWGQARLDENITAQHPLRRSLSSFFCLPTARTLPLLDLQQAKKHPVLSRYCKKYEENIAKRSFFHTDSEYIGFGPKNTSENDSICLLLGYFAPVVLRPNGDKFEFVGTCYLHGAMYGEGMHPEMGFDSRHYPGSRPQDEWKMFKDPRPTRSVKTLTNELQNLLAARGPLEQQEGAENDGLLEEWMKKFKECLVDWENDEQVMEEDDEEGDEQGKEGDDEGDDKEDDEEDVEEDVEEDMIQGEYEEDKEEMSPEAGEFDEFLPFVRFEDAMNMTADALMEQTGIIFGEDPGSARAAASGNVRERQFWFIEEEREPLLITTQQIRMI